MARNDLLKKTFVCSSSGKLPTQVYMHELFITDMESWNFIDSVCLDIRDGTPYFVHNICRNVGGSYGSDMHLKAINYDTVRELSRGNDFADLNENTWRFFIPEEKLLKTDKRAIKIAPDMIKSVKWDLKQFYWEVNHVYYHTLVFLRETNSGYRIFYVSPQGWQLSFGFKFNRTEEMVQEILSDKNNQYVAYDRLLSKEETDYLQTIAKGIKNSLPSFKREQHIKCLQQWKHIRMHQKQGKWYNFQITCQEMAEYGSNFSLPINY